MPKNAEVRRLAARRWIALSTVAAAGIGASGVANAQEIRGTSPSGKHQITSERAAPIWEEFQLASNEGGELVRAELSRGLKAERVAMPERVVKAAP